MTSFTVIVPARYASSRLPAKPLALIGEKPLIRYVVEQAMKSSAKRVVVATDDERIVDVVRGFGGEFVMTSSSHESGTDRIEEAVRQLGLSDNEIVVNVQGDEPLIPPAVIDQVANDLVESGGMMSTLCEPVTCLADIMNPNIVKVVRNVLGNALYFSRAPIPFARDEFPSAGKDACFEGWYRHLGIYAYTTALLRQFVSWSPSPLERIEKLEQLRVLWNGQSIRVCTACQALPAGVDTPADLERVRTIILGAERK
jgi:3-deoxy-manno-octulosonate cytidylyltransferase (CMP-KDO synthetase)